MAYEILGESPPIEDLRKLLKKISGAPTTILVLGESGTGKELIARNIHELGPRKIKPFVAINCGAIPENLIESELFGHTRGSFTGAVGDKPGLFEVANEGTLFLDEIGELPLGMQVKLLRAIQDRAIRRVGGSKTIAIDVRIVAATNRDLELEMKNGRFREDLYYRLNVIQVKAPALRDRGSDVEFLARVFLKKFAASMGKEVKDFDKKAWEAIRAYAWPGNVRELQNVIERTVSLTQGVKITLEALPDTIVGVNSSDEGRARKPSSPGATDSDFIRIPRPDFSKGAIELDEILGAVEKQYLSAALKHTKGAKKPAADLLGITFRSFRYRLKKLDIE